FPIGHHGEHWIGTAENHPDDSTEPGTLQGDVKTGTLLSKPFVLTERFITFLIGGKADLDLLRVELWVHAEPGDLDAAPLGGSLFKLVKKTTGHDSERMRREAFDAGDYVGQFCRIRIVDLSSTGHLNVDDFRFQPAHPLFTKVRVGGVEHESVVWFESHLYDWDSPVWGLADMHTHPMAHLGLGRKIFHGQPDGDLKEALSDCNCDHGGWGLDNPCGNYLRQIAVAAFDSEAMNDHQLGWDPNQWKRFQKWPIFTSYSHQQMWHEWVKRAYDGGLRVMVALTVHNHLLAQATINSVPPLDDQSVMMTQITELKAFVDRHSDFLEIAYDPFQLRDIVRRNKLAIIIGSETDDIGNFDQNPLVSELGDELSKTLVRGRLQELHDAGLRYIFPVHLTDNKFAGTAVYNALFAVATKFYMGEKLQVEGADGGIQYKLPDLNAAHYLPSAGDILGKMAEALVNPVAPVQMMVELNGQVMGSHQNLSDSSMGLGAVSSVSLLPVIASVGVVAAPVLIDFFGDFASLKLPEDIYPLGNNYPPYASIGVNHTGHRNAKPLTQLGDFAIREMMRLGMMIDLDHMDERGVTNVLAVAEQVPGGYPLNSGHNSFRAIRYDASENQRTPDHLQRIQKLGGMMGLGWGNTDTRYASEGLGHNPTQTSSAVDNDSPGSSKTFAQAAEYALEFMGRRQVALGTDINGFVVGPGPRFGPQSGFGQREENLGMRSQFIAAQENGILYEEREGRPGTTAVFNGHAVDQDKDDQDARTWLGYRYNKQQRDFFVALRIFRWGWSQDPKMTAEGVQEITDNMNHDGYDWNRVKEFARGLLLGPGNGDAGSDIDPDVNVKQKLAKAVYRRKTFGEAPPDEIFNDTNRYRRYKHFIKVWEDYEKVYGQNTPMKRAETDLVQWDYNWDGLAHYGLLPDFFQDLSNVGLKPEDMSPLFNSSEGVARMWTRCLDAADAIQHPFLHVIIDTSGSRVYFQWYGELGDLIEESTDVEGRSGWHAFKGVVLQGGPASAAVIPVDPGAPIRFYRIRKP
ncbi:MAG TPA: hypothetical protein DCM86_12200, partial [Verrucomicrobiales bacterium]|nr:hypothetical protein [Verrucomicrobiales bacterium]